MRAMFNRAAVAALCLAMTSGSAMAAVNDCWSQQEISAAKVRDLQSMLMVAALRCNGSGVNVLARYNGFVTSNRAQLVQANNALKTYFNRISGPAEGQRRYDRFTTALANNYGAGGGGDCGEMANFAQEAQAAGSLDALASLADERGLSPELPSMRCPVSVAQK